MIEYKTVHSTSEYGLSDDELNELGKDNWDLINLIRARVMPKVGYQKVNEFMFFFKRNTQKKG